MSKSKSKATKSKSKSKGKGKADAVRAMREAAAGADDASEIEIIDEDGVPTARGGSKSRRQQQIPGTEIPVDDDLEADGAAYVRCASEAATARQRAGEIKLRLAQRMQALKIRRYRFTTDDATYVIEFKPEKLAIKSDKHKTIDAGDADE